MSRTSDGKTLLLGAGELHLDVSLSRLRTLAGVSARVRASPPAVPLRETVVGTSPRAWLGKSANKHNRVYAVAEPLDAQWRAVLQALPEGTSENARRAALRAAGVSSAALRSITVFGNFDNVIINRCAGVSLAPIADSLRAALHALEPVGVLVAANHCVSGVAFVITDAKV